MIRRGGARPRIALTCITACLSVAATAALAQEERARSLILDFSQGLEVSSNPDLEDDPMRDEVVLRSDVDLRYVTATRGQSLEFGVGAGLEGGRFADGDSGGRVAERRADFVYERTSAAGLFRVATEYTRARVEDSDVPEDFESDDLDITTGERGEARLQVDLETGRNRRIGTEVTTSLSSLRYFDNDGDGRDTLDLQAALRLSVQPRTDILLLSGLSSRKNDGDDQYEAETVSAGLGFRHALTARQRISGELRAMRLETSEISETSGEREEDRQEGLGGAMRYEADLGRGTFGLEYDSALYSTGRRDVLELSHERSSDAGSLLVSLGVVDSDRLDGEPLVNVAWTRNIPRGQLQLRLDQDASGNQDGDQEAIRTRVTAGYIGQINSISSWQTQLSLADSNEFGEDAEDSRRTELLVGYRHALARDWDVSMRYRHILAEGDGRDDRRDNSVFLGLATRLQLK